MLMETVKKWKHKVTNLCRGWLVFMIWKTARLMQKNVYWTQKRSTVTFLYGLCFKHFSPINTGWGKITSLNFKVNNKKTIQDTKLLFLDSETTTWEVLNHIVLKRISCKWWPLLSMHARYSF
jgi:hypothetical protein